MLAYERRGDGPPLVLLHVLGGSRRMWRPVLGGLGLAHETIALDLPGFGESAPLAGVPTVPRLADAVAATFTELGLERPAVCGISLGGGIALELARRGLVSACAPISPIGFATRAELTFARGSLRTTILACRAMAGQVDRVAEPAALRTALGAQMFARPAEVPPEDIAALARGLAESPGTRATLRGAFGYEVTGGGQELPVPTTVLWGQRDALLRPRQARRVVTRLPLARVAPLPGCGHVPVWDDPGLVSRAILDAVAPPG